MRWLRPLMRRHTDVEDPHTVNVRLIRRVAPVIDAFCKVWYRLGVEGLDNLPDGPALLVGNHNSGTTFLEGVGFAAAARLHDPDAPPWHGLGHDVIVDMPLLGPLLARLGTVRANHEAADRAFALERKVMVFPGGNLEAFRPWRQRNEVVFAGRKGWARLALRHGVPVSPIVFHGGHNGFFVLSDGRRLVEWTGLKRWLRTDAWPLFVGLPWGIAFGPLFHLPLPVKCTTVVLPPIGPFGSGEEAAADEELVQRLYDEVHGVMQDALARLAVGGAA
jgi:1-acyl-sn-glycerol-3-phosphate acyltransferase